MRDGIISVRDSPTRQLFIIRGVLPFYIISESEHGRLIIAHNFHALSSVDLAPFTQEPVSGIDDESSEILTFKVNGRTHGCSKNLPRTSRSEERRVGKETRDRGARRGG